MQLSHSRVETFGTCQYKYKLRYLDKVKTIAPTDADSALVLGTAVHTGIEKSLKDAISEYLNSYPIITDDHINEVIKLEQVIPAARDELPLAGSLR